MTSRYDDLSDRARWYLNNFDEIDLADICASQEASNQKRQEAIDRVQHVADLIEAGAPWTASRANTARRIRDAANTSRHDAGPSVKECAEADRVWPLEKAGE